MKQLKKCWFKPGRLGVTSDWVCGLASVGWNESFCTCREESSSSAGVKQNNYRRLTTQQAPRERRLESRAKFFGKTRWWFQFFLKNSPKGKCSSNLTTAHIFQRGWLVQLNHQRTGLCGVGTSHWPGSLVRRIFGKDDQLRIFGKAICFFLKWNCGNLLISLSCL